MTSVFTRLTLPCKSILCLPRINHKVTSSGMKHHFKAYLGAIMTAIAVLGLTGILEQAETRRFQQRHRAEVLARVGTVRARLEEALNQRIFLTRGLVAYISTVDSNITRTTYERLTSVIVGSVTGIRCISLHKNTIHIYSYPWKGNEKAIGYDPAADPAKREWVLQAIKTRRTIVTGPDKLAQGGFGFITRTPIYLTPSEQSPESGSFWGLVGIVIDQDTLYKDAGLLDKSSPIQVAIRGKNGRGAEGEVFFGDAALFQQNPVLLPVTLPNGSWQIAAIPKAGWSSHSPLSHWIWMGGGIIALLVGGVIFILVSAPVRLQVAVDRAVALNQKLQKENLRMGAELEVARKIQQMILPMPEELENIKGLDIAGFMEPAAEVGGDYYDVIQQNGSVKISIGDVTGHGLESGMLMLMTQTAVRTLQESNQTDPVQFFDILNRTIYHNAQRISPDKNLTLALLDYHNGTLSLSGQHEEMIVVRSGGKVERIDTINLGFPIGLDEEIADLIASEQVQLNPGDVVVLYTDGITEAFDIYNEQYGLERLCKVVSRNCDRTTQEIRQAVIDDVRRHIGEQKVFDDITLVVIKQK